MTTEKLAGKCSKPERAVKDEEDKTITEIQGQRVRHFEKLLNRPVPLNPPDNQAAPTDLPIDVTALKTEEIRMPGHQKNQEWESSRS
ncbi:unnamed protein product [Schistosoma margrebowiei]|uniref:Uncharacterized protein n=1 Tax=Schistosoma margrebowiei TaxID=48269 RepID=A0A183LWB6_9TREM|nr:unnamed protein product [Schistosoma margrebowiei]